MNDSLNWVKEIVAEYAPKLALALVTLVVGWILIRYVVRIVEKSIGRSRVDESLRNFILTLVSISLKILLIFSVANTFGIVTTSFIAVLGAAGLAIGMALQGSLSHFAAGVLILFFKPYRIGDYVEVVDKAGTVKEIQVFSTLLTTLNNNLIIVPNGEILKYPIVNYTILGKRKIALEFGIAYNADIDLAKDIIAHLFRNHELVLAEEGIDVFVASHGISSVNLTARAWTKSEDFWTVSFYMLEQVIKEFNKAGIEIPFPQMDVHFPDKPAPEVTQN